MKKKLTIIGDISQKNDIESFCSQLKNVGVDAIATYPAVDFSSRAAAICAPVAILWIGTETGPEVFNAAVERDKKQLHTLNYFAEGVTLSEMQKDAVGRNQSVFAAVNPHGCVNGLISLLPLDIMTQVAPSLHTTLIPKDNMNDGLSQPVPKAQLIKEDNSGPIDHNNTKEAETEVEGGPKELAPGKSILEMIGTLIGVILVARMLSLDERSIGWYIVLFAPIIINFILLLRVNNWRKTHGFNFMMLLAFIVWILISLICLSVMWYSLVMAF